MTPPRIAPLPRDDRDERTAEMLDGLAAAQGQELNIFSTLARHPRLFRHWSRFGGAMLDGELPFRDRELLILRTGWLCRSDYEWGQHARIARNGGIGEDDIARVAAGAAAEGWDDFEAALLTAADELHADGVISDATWAVLAQRYDDKQLIEVPMLVGQYHLVAFTLNSLGVEREPGVEGLPQ
jgi:4-carboxymuconolactone decarboxylase